MTTIEASGMSIEVPRGWDATITTPERDLRGAHRGGRTFPVLHAGNFALPPNRGDYGSGAVEIMGGGAVLVCLLEFDPMETKSVLFGGKTIPRSVQARDFSPDAMQRTMSGMSGTQYFGVERNRAMVLYIVLGSHARRSVLVPEVNRVLPTLRIS